MLYWLGLWAGLLLLQPGAGLRLPGPHQVLPSRPQHQPGYADIILSFVGVPTLRKAAPPCRLCHVTPPHLPAPALTYSCSALCELAMQPHSFAASLIIVLMDSCVYRGADAD